MSLQFTLRRLTIALILLITAVAPAEWKESVLYSFQGGSTDGFWPVGGVVLDQAGNLYGATEGGGPASCYPDGSLCGAVYELSPPTSKGAPWTGTVLVQFKGKQSNDVSLPSGGLIMDSSGNLYGVSAYGGTGTCVLLGTSAGCGTVYELSPPQENGGSWTETILYSFQGGNDGYYAWGSLIFDKAGNLYGATQFGGGKGTACNEFYGGNCGIVFELSPPKQKDGKWREKVLHSFAGLVGGKQNGDGANPNGGLIFDRKGAIYGTTYSGGDGGGPCGRSGCGTVFKLASSHRGVWTETILHSFKGADGGEPAAGLVFHKSSLYGTTYGGGIGHNGGSPWGTVFSLSRNADGSWSEVLLHTFQHGYDGAQPRAKVAFGPGGDLYGTAPDGGASFAGTVFRLNQEEHWKLKPLYNFKGVGRKDGAGPGQIVFNSAGTVFGTTQGGGGGTCEGGCGTVFELTP